MIDAMFSPFACTIREERSGGVQKRSSPDKAHSSKHTTAVDHHHMDSKNSNHHPYHDSPVVHANGGEKLVVERFELPRIYISLSRKEKEDDFLAMKGSKLPQRPKKRAKNVDKSLQVCIIRLLLQPTNSSDRI
jgi:hypothetical protein